MEGKNIQEKRLRGNNIEHSRILIRQRVGGANSASAVAGSCVFEKSGFTSLAGISAPYEQRVADDVAK